MIDPLPQRERPPRDWAEVTLEDGTIVVSLHGWRAVLAVKRRVVIPLAAVEEVTRDSLVYEKVPTSLRRKRHPHTHLWRLGVYRGYQGWSFWACGLARNAVVISTDDYRFKFVVVETTDPAGLVSLISSAVGEHRRAHPKEPSD